MLSEPLINTAKYTPVELVFFALGGLSWAVAYVAVLHGVFKRRFVEIPAAAVVANISWEFTWGIVYRTDLGAIFAWGYRLWFVLDLVIVWGLLRYGVQSLRTPRLREAFRGAALLAILAWAVTLLLFVRQGYDTTTGLVSGYAVTLMMSALYIPHFLREPDKSRFSPVAAWAKLFGNGLVIVFCSLALGDNHLLLTLCVTAVVLDVAYLVLFYRHRRRDAASA